MGNRQCGIARSRGMDARRLREADRGARRGRPPTLGAEAIDLLKTLFTGTPAEHGHAGSTWTVPLFLHVLEEYGYRSCERTLRNLLHKLGYGWDHRTWERL